MAGGPPAQAQPTARSLLALLDGVAQAAGAAAGAAAAPGGEERPPIAEFVDAFVIYAAQPGAAARLDAAIRSAEASGGAAPPPSPDRCTEARKWRVPTEVRGRSQVPPKCCAECPLWGAAWVCGH